MAQATTFKLQMDMLLGRDTVSKKFIQLEKQVQNLGRLNAQGVKTASPSAVVAGINKNTLNAFKRRFGDIGNVMEKSFNKGSISANRFDARLLSLLFSGMALKRTFGSIIRSITNTFTKANDDTSALGKETTKLSAAWEFFKFSIFDALNTDFFIGMIDGMTKLLDKFSQAPGLLKTILVGSFGLFALGTALMTIAQVKLAWNAIFNAGGFLSVSGGIIGTAGTGVTAGIGLLGIAGALLVITGFVAGAVLSFNKFKDETKPLLDSITNAFGTSFKNISDDIKLVTSGMSAWEVLSRALAATFLTAFIPVAATLNTLLVLINGVIDGIDLIVKGFDVLRGDMSISDWMNLRKKSVDEFKNGMGNSLDIVTTGIGAIADIINPTRDTIIGGFTDATTLGVDPFSEGVSSANDNVTILNNSILNLPSKKTIDVSVNVDVNKTGDNGFSIGSGIANSIRSNSSVNRTVG